MLSGICPGKEVPCRVDGLVRGVKGWGGAEYDAHVKPLLEQLRPLARDLGNRASSFVHDLRGN